MTDTPAPNAVRWDREFYENAAEGRLVAQECVDCGHLQHYPRPGCQKCLSRNRRWRELSGKGRIYSFTIVHRPASPEFRAEAPYVLADVELAEGVRIVSIVRDVLDLARVCVGADVVVSFRESGQGVSLPFFVLARSGED
jgi:uncharacterized OB-fold protein